MHCGRTNRGEKVSHARTGAKILSDALHDLHDCIPSALREL